MDEIANSRNEGEAHKNVEHMSAETPAWVTDATDKDVVEIEE